MGAITLLQDLEDLAQRAYGLIAGQVVAHKEGTIEIRLREAVRRDIKFLEDGLWNSVFRRQDRCAIPRAGERGKGGDKEEGLTGGMVQYLELLRLRGSRVALKCPETR